MTSQAVALHAEDEVTPAEPARMLGVTRQFVVRLCKNEFLPFRRLPNSTHRRIRVQDVLDLSAERKQMRTGSAAIRDVLDD